MRERERETYCHNLCLSFNFPQGCFLFKFEEVVLCLGRFVLNKHCSLQRRALCQMALRRSCPAFMLKLSQSSCIAQNSNISLNKYRGKGTLGQLHSNSDHSWPSRHINWIARQDTVFEPHAQSSCWGWEGQEFWAVQGAIVWQISTISTSLAT